MKRDSWEAGPGTQAVWAGEDEYLLQGATQVPVVHSVSFGYQDIDTWTYTSGTTTIDHSGGFASHGDLTNNGSATYSGSVAELTTGRNVIGQQR